MKKISVIMIISLLMITGLQAQNVQEIDFKSDIHKKVQLTNNYILEKQNSNPDWSEYLQRDSRYMDNYDVLYYKIDLQLDFDDQLITGDNIIRINILEDNTGSVIFDFTENLQLDMISIDGEVLNYSHQDDQITVDLGQDYNLGDQVEISIQYNGHPVPASGLELGLAFTSHNGSPIAYTMVEPYASRDWWPCKDIPTDKADSIDVYLTYPEEYLSASNGVLVSEVNNEDGTRTDHWFEKYPISTYLVSIAISNYDLYIVNYDYYGYDMEIRNYIYPELYDDGVELFAQTPDMMEFLTDLFCEYPFADEKYGHAVVPGGGAMEHQTCTSFGAPIVNEYGGTIVMHELAHQWTGDLITCDTWAHVWLNEGFASYSQALWEEYLYGDAAYHQYMDLIDIGSNIDDQLRRDEGDQVLDIVVYYKGAWVLHMLRNIIGDENLFNAFQAYVLDSELRYGTAETDDLTDIVESISGVELSWFFDQWFNYEGRPTYSFATYESENVDSLKISILSEGSATEAFSMFVDCNINDSDHRFWVPAGVSLNVIPLDEELNSIIMDPENWVLDYGYLEQLPVLQENIFTRDNSIQLNWDEYFDSNIEGMNIYRRTDEEEYTLINENPVSGSQYIDNDVEDGVTYYYKISAVLDGENGFIGKFSNEITADPVMFSFDEGILLVDQTFNYPETSPFPTDSEVDDFYLNLLQEHQTTAWDVNEQGLPLISDLAKYSTVIWHNDDIAGSPLTGYSRYISYYLQSGGNFILSTWSNMQSLDEGICSEIFFIENIDSCMDPEFIGSIGENGYSDMVIDSEKIPLQTWGESLQFCNIFEPLNEDDIIFRFDSDDNDSSWENEVCGIRRLGDYNLCILGFPLYYIDQNSAEVFIETILSEFGEISEADDEIVHQNIQVQNYPNPFNPETKFSFNVPQSLDGERVTLDIYNIKGQLVKTIYNGIAKQGDYNLTWTGNDERGAESASGLYLYRLKIGKENSQTKKMLLLR